jgi:hypothetical protein
MSKLNQFYQEITTKKGKIKIITDPVFTTSISPNGDRWMTSYLSLTPENQKTLAETRKKKSKKVKYWEIYNK